jgi:HSP20 family protein
MKLSIFDRFTGNGSDSFDSFDEELEDVPARKGFRELVSESSRPAPLEEDAPQAEGQLPVDVHQTANEIVVRAFVAGVRPDELSISIGRDMVEIEGSRSERTQVSGPDYFTRELFWGSFSRVISLPEEIDVDAATATSKDGLLTLVLPKLDKKRQTKLKVKAG